MQNIIIIIIAIRMTCTVSTHIENRCRKVVAFETVLVICAAPYTNVFSERVFISFFFIFVFLRDGSSPFSLSLARALLTPHPPFPLRLRHYCCYLSYYCYCHRRARLTLASLPTVWSLSSLKGESPRKPKHYYRHHRCHRRHLKNTTTSSTQRASAYIHGGMLPLQERVQWQDAPPGGYRTIAIANAITIVWSVLSEGSVVCRRRLPRGRIVLRHPARECTVFKEGRRKARRRGNIAPSCVNRRGW